MGRFIRVIMCIWVLSTWAVAGWAASREPRPPAPTLPMLLATVGPTQVMLHAMQADDHRLVLEIRCPDVTSMPSRSALHLSFDARIADVTESRAPMPLRLETAVADQQVTLSLARDPFAFPQPWSYTLTIAFDQFPDTGTITLGNLPPQPVTYPSSPPVVPVNTLPGT